MDSCYENGKRKGEPLFTVRAQDETSSLTVIDWIGHNIETAPAEKLHAALDVAIAMRDWPSKRPAD